MYLSCIALLVLATVAYGYEFSETERQKLANAQPNMFNRYVRSEISRQRRLGVTSHWCCKNGKPTKLLQKTRVKSTPVTITDKIKIGYTNCKGLGMGRCSLYDLRYRQALEYSVEYYDIPDEQSCDDKDVICCDGYLNIGGNCIIKESAADKEFVEGLKDLLGSGLLNMQ
ncbi:uncharacterized protein LOC141899835 [Tubulanus polymorphus]|uniref:uncharacterized protein LOC141899835 n=1 Tax=Tubulanus polymorphus TaxID=672921 RepID=UPI003DA2DB42